MTDKFIDDLQNAWNGATDISRIGKSVTMTPFVNSVKKNKIKEVEGMLGRGIDPNFTVFSGDAPIHIAIRRGYHEIVELFIRYDADLNIQRKSIGRETPLDIAVMRNNSHIIQSLIKNGARVNELKSNGWAPLHQATSDGKSDIIHALLTAGAEAGFLTKGGRSALRIAVDRGQVSSLKALLKYPEIARMVNKTFLYNDIEVTMVGLAVLLKRTKILSCLIDAGANVNKRDEEGWTSLYHAIRNGDSVAVQILIEAGADVIRVENEQKFSLLHVASSLKPSADKVKIMEALLRNGADVNKQSVNGSTPLLISVHIEDLDAVKLLFKYKAKPDMYDVSGCTPIFKAMKLKTIDIMQSFIDAKANLNLPDKIKGRTILHFVAQTQNIDMAQLLIDNGANSQSKDKGGKSPMDYVLNKTIKTLLKRSISSVNDNQRRNIKRIPK